MVLDTSGLNGKAIEVSKYCFLAHLSQGQAFVIGRHQSLYILCNGAKKEPALGVTCFA